MSREGARRTAKGLGIRTGFNVEGVLPGGKGRRTTKRKVRVDSILLHDAPEAHAHEIIIWPE